MQIGTWNGGGPVLEIPVRAPGLPVNLWLRWAAIAFNPIDWKTEEGTANASWRRQTFPINGPALEVGDTALAGQATCSLAQIRRETQWIIDTDDWGVAMSDWVLPLTVPVTGPASPTFGGQEAYLGQSFAVGASVTIDLLVVRAALLPTSR